MRSENFANSNYLSSLPVSMHISLVDRLKPEKWQETAMFFLLALLYLRFFSYPLTMTIYHSNLIDKAGRKQIIAELAKVIEQAPWFVPKMKNGSSFRYRMSNAGKYGWVSDREGYRYVQRNPYTKEQWPAIPSPVLAVIKQLDEARVIPSEFNPESMLINQYLPGESLGIHQDRTEKNTDAPIVSISLGCPGIFLLGGSRRSDAVREIVLEPGDVLVMSGKDRMRFHGFKGITTGTKRINLTIRQVY